jgi:hypothetical protein
MENPVLNKRGNRNYYLYHTKYHNIRYIVNIGFKKKWVKIYCKNVNSANLLLRTDLGKFLQSINHNHLEPAFITDYYNSWIPNLENVENVEFVIRSMEVLIYKKFIECFTGITNYANCMKFVHIHEYINHVKKGDYRE